MYINLPHVNIAQYTFGNIFNKHFISSIIYLLFQLELSITYEFKEIELDDK